MVSYPQKKCGLLEVEMSQETEKHESSDPLEEFKRKLHDATIQAITALQQDPNLSPTEVAALILSTLRTNTVLTSIFFAAKASDSNF
jgi:hypothetical protein